MKRIQLFEFEDFDWFPAVIRSGMTNLIVVLHKLFGTHEVIAGLLENVRTKYNFSQIVDMGSGSGGPMPEVVRTLNAENPERPVKLILSDLHPNPSVVEQFNKLGEEAIQYHPNSLDATRMDKAPAGLKTMINSFHHMPPERAKQILRSAQKNREALLIYEIGENNIPTLLWWLLLPISLCILIIMVLFMTPFVKPLRFSQLFFTYLVPIIPLCYAWDGQASIVRMYTFKDVEALLEGLRTDDYSWEMAPATKENGKKQGYYILGIPKVQPNE